MLLPADVRSLVSRLSSFAILSGVVFAVAHLPRTQPDLCHLLCRSRLYRDLCAQGNLYVVALIHAVLGFTLAVSAPDAWFHELRVGRDFLHTHSTILAHITLSR